MRKRRTSTGIRALWAVATLAFLGAPVLAWESDDAGDPAAAVVKSSTVSRTAAAPCKAKPRAEERQTGVLPASLAPRACPRLDECAEYTKPDSLCMRRLGTPQNHRAPPA